MKFVPFRKKKSTSERIAEQVSDAADKLTEQATATAASVKHHATETAASLKHQAGESAAALTERAAERMPKVAKSGDQLAKDVKLLAMQAATAAVELLENARDRSQASAVAAPARAQFDHATNAVSERAKSAETALVEQAQRLLELAKQVELPIESSVAVAKDKSREAAESAAKAGKNGLAIAFWSTALVAIVLYIVMGKERRDRTIKRARAAAAEVQELVHDYRGHDAEMETA